MRLAIVHYHLRKGGVTRVITSALQALGREVSEVVVLSSTPPEEPLPCPVGVIPELAYVSGASESDARVLHDALVRTASRHLGQSPDIWHIHNHCLGKNVNFPEALRRLLADGQRVLLQVHVQRIMPPSSAPIPRVSLPTLKNHCFPSLLNSVTPFSMDAPAISSSRPGFRKNASSGSQIRSPGHPLKDR